MPKIAANLTMLYNEHAFLDRSAAAAADGFEAVEFMFPYDVPARAIAEQLERHGLTLVLHNLPAGDWAAGERGIAVLPGRQREFQDGVARAKDYATSLGCGMVNCLVGLTPQAGDAAATRARLVDNLRHAASEFAAAGIKLLVEPVNSLDIPGFHLDTVEKAVSIMDEVGHANLWLQYDFYHRQRAGGELLATFRRYKDRIAHVQLADNPGRNEPGTGEINYPAILAALDREGYAGWIGCEYKPAAGTSAGLGWAQSYLRR